MGNLIDLPNISPDSIILDESVNTRPTESNNGFSLQNYLNLRLSEGEEEKTVIFRPLPMDIKTGAPWVKVHTHNVQVPKEMVKSGKPFKSYICLSKTTNIDHEKFGSKCPFCEINQQAYLESTKTTDAVKKKNLQEISVANLAKESVIMRGIERGKEDEGVKFWKFNIRPDKTDPYNQIVKLYNLRNETAKKKGGSENILDIYNGRDLIITVGGEGTAAPTIVDDSDKSPVTTDEEQLKKWIYDEKKWQDVFTCKPYEYLALVAQMKIPWYDKTKGVWVDKEEYEANRNLNKDNVNNEIAKAENEIKKGAEESSNEAQNDFAASITLDDNGDLPF